VRQTIKDVSYSQMLEIMTITCTDPPNSSQVPFLLKLWFLISWKQKNAFVTWQNKT